jgi:exosortase/archaeosortase
MKLKSFLSIAGTLAVVFGLGFAGFPARTLTLYGVVATPGTTILARFLGATLLDIGFVLLLVRGVTEQPARRGVVWGSLAGAVLGLLVAVHGQRIGAVNAFGWSSVAIYAMLTLGYAYFAFGDPERK